MINTTEDRVVRLLRATQRRNPDYAKLCQWIIAEICSGAYMGIPLDNKPTKDLR